MFKVSELVLLVVLIGGISFLAGKMGTSDSQAPVIIMPEQIQNTGDDRYSRAPRPQRLWNNPQENPVRGALDPIPTRGAPESYQQMGVMVGEDGKALPLYGRRVAPRSDRFNYYTRTDTYNPVALPIKSKKRDCQDNLGCDELFNGDDIVISPTGEKASVTLYGFDGPRYVPP